MQNLCSAIPGNVIIACYKFFHYYLNDSNWILLIFIQYFQLLEYQVFTANFVSTIRDNDMVKKSWKKWKKVEKVEKFSFCFSPNEEFFC